MRAGEITWGIVGEVMGMRRLWRYEVMGVWGYGSVRLWVYGVMGVWGYGCMRLWVYGVMGVRSGEMLGEITSMRRLHRRLWG